MKRKVVPINIIRENLSALNATADYMAVPTSPFTRRKRTVNGFFRLDNRLIVAIFKAW
jgi:hypothetical protein